VNARTPIIAALFTSSLLGITEAQARETWPSEASVEGFTEQVVHTSTAELGAYDCTPASVVMAARTLGMRQPIHASVAVAAIRQEARWPLDGIGLPLDRAGKVLEKRGATVEYLEGVGISGISKAVNRGAVALLCGRNGRNELHTIAVVDYSVAEDIWLIHDPDQEEPAWVSSVDLRRFRQNGCKDKIDLLVQPRGSKPLMRGKSSSKSSDDAADAAEAKGGKSRKKAGKKKSANKKAGNKKAGNKSSEGRAAKAPAAARSASTDNTEDRMAEDPGVPRGGLGLGLALLAGLLAVLGGAIVGVRRGWFERYDLDEDE